MGLDPLSLTLFYEEVEQQVVETALSYCLEQGCTTRREGNSGDYRYLGAHSDFDSILIDRTTAERYLSDRGGGIHFWYRDFDFTLWITPSQFKNRPPNLDLSIDVTHLKPSNGSEEAVEQRVLQLLEFTGGLVEQTSPAVGYGAIDDHIEDEGGLIADIPAETVLDARADLVHWFTYLPQTCVERTGRDYIQETPAWHIAELKTGGVILVASAQPLFGGEKERQRIAEWLGFEGPHDRKRRAG